MLKKVLFNSILLAAVIPAFALASPGIPHKFYGNISIPSGAIPDGKTVQAKIDGAVVGSSVTVGGKYGYLPNLLFALDENNVNGGKEIKFYVDGVEASEAAVFSNGASTNLNLAVNWQAPAEPEPPAPPAPEPGFSGSGGGGGSSVSGSSVSQTATTVVKLSPLAKVVDRNNDNKVDILDFNFLMVNWTNPGMGNQADYNNDNKVDILDFNLLMINWTS